MGLHPASVFSLWWPSKAVYWCQGLRRSCSCWPRNRHFQTYCSIHLQVLLTKFWKDGTRSFLERLNWKPESVFLTSLSYSYLLAQIYQPNRGCDFSVLLKTSHGSRMFYNVITDSKDSWRLLNSHFDGKFQSGFAGAPSKILSWNLVHFLGKKGYFHPHITSEMSTLNWSIYMSTLVSSKQNISWGNFRFLFTNSLSYFFNCCFSWARDQL